MQVIYVLVYINTGLNNARRVESSAFDYTLVVRIVNDTRNSNLFPAEKYICWCNTAAPIEISIYYSLLVLELFRIGRAQRRLILHKGERFKYSLI